MDINDVLAVVDSDAAGSLCLSKGGWEGWLQCELWRYLTLGKDEVVERELAYPGSRDRCDLVISSSAAPPLWVEIKAFGIFREGDADRFLDSIGLDMMKLEFKPHGARGLALVVVPTAIGDALHAALQARKWFGFERTNSKYASVYHLTF